VYLGYGRFSIKSFGRTVSSPTVAKSHENSKALAWLLAFACAPATVGHANLGPAQIVEKMTRDIIILEQRESCNLAKRN